MERLGFIDALVMWPANIASSKMTPPNAITGIVPISLLPLERLQ